MVREILSLPSRGRHAAGRRGSNRAGLLRRRAAAVTSLAAILSGTILMVSPALGADTAAQQQVGGFVFDDKNVDGIFQGYASGDANEPGVNGVTVTAFSGDNVVVGTDVTHMVNKHKGAWAIDVSTIVRIEFTKFPGGYVSSIHGPNPSPDGDDSGTAVQFASPDDTHVNFGVRSDKTSKCDDQSNSDNNERDRARLIKTGRESQDRHDDGGTGSAGTEGDSCAKPKTEIGNWVWRDTNGNGIQDPGEQGIGGVTVNLYDSGDNLVDSAITDPTGLYYFLIDPTVPHTIRLDNGDDLLAGGPLDELQPSPIMIDGAAGALHDANDPTGTSVPTGVVGASDHSFDFGFYRASLDVVKEVLDVTAGQWRDANSLDDAPVLAVGSAALYRFTITNTGDVALAGITVSDPYCTSAIVPLPVDVSIRAGESLVFNCLHAPLTKADDGHVNTVTVSGATPASTDGETVGQPIDGGVALPEHTDIATITVLEPAVTVRKFVLAHGGDATNTTGASVTPGDFGPNNQWVDGDTIGAAALLSVGDTPTWLIVVTNTGETDLSDISIGDAVVPECASPIGFLAPGDTQTVTCTSPAIAAFTGVTNAAHATATPTVGEMPFPNVDEGNLTIDSNENPASYKVAHPGVDIRKRLKDVGDPKTPDMISVVAGGSATFPIVVTNTGNVALHNVAVTDAVHPACSVVVGDLAIGESHSYDCTVDGIDKSAIDTAAVAAVDPNGEKVGDTDRLDIRAVPVGLTITKKVRLRDSGNSFAKTATVPVLGVAQWEIVVTNSSAVDIATDGALVNPKFTDVVLADCATALDQAVAGYDGQPAKGRPAWVGSTDTYLLQGDSIAVTCDLPIDSANGATGHITNTIDASAITKIGASVSATDSAQVVIPHVSVRIIKEVFDLNGQPAKTATLTAGKDVVWKITVLNNGLDALLDTAVADGNAPNCAVNLGTMVSGDAQTYVCTSSKFVTDITNTATASGHGADGEKVSATDSATATAVSAGISILKEVFDPVTSTWKDGDSIAGSPGSNLGDAGSFGVGGTAQFRVTVANTGHAALQSVHVVDTWCNLDQTVDLPAVGAPNNTNAVTFVCTHAGLTLTDNGHVNTATASGARPVFVQNETEILGMALPTVSENAQVKVSDPKLLLKKYILRKGGNPAPANPTTNKDWLDGNQAASGANYASGDHVDYLIVVTNAGTISIDHVKVIDAQLPACSRSETDLPALAAMAPGAVVAWTCGLDKVAASYINTATASGQPELGGPLQPPVPLATSTDTAVVTVSGPNAGDPTVLGTTVQRNPTAVQGSGLAVTGAASQGTMQVGLALLLGGLMLLTPTIVGNHRRRVRGLYR